MTDLVDPRQRQAAAILLCAIALPAPLEAVAQAWKAAARVLPGITLEHARPGDRPAQLRRARDLIDQCLSEIT